MAADDIANIGFGVDTSGLDKADKKLDEVERSTKRLGESGSRNMGQAGRAFDSFSGRATTALTKVNERMTRFIGQAAKVGAVVGAAGLVGALFKSVQAFSQFETQLIAVGKTANLEGRQLERLGERVQMIARRVPVSTNRLLELAAAAGQLGVSGVDDLARFAETVGKLGIASDLAGEQAARALSRILTVTGEANSQVDRLGSTIVQLGNSFAATESEITDVATRVAQATVQFNIATSEVLGIATALKAVGVRAEAGGTVIGRAFQAINDALRQGGKEMRALQDITGQTQEALREAFFGGQATKVFQSFVSGLGRVQESGGDVTSALSNIGLEGVRVIQTLSTLATRSEVLAEAVGMANTEWETNTALNIEAAKQAKSFRSQMRFLGNALNEAAVDIGRELAPVILDLTEKFRDFIQEASDSGQLERFFENVADKAQVLVDQMKVIGRIMAALAGARLGAGAGSVFGPVGTGVGGVGGAAVGFFSPELAGMATSDPRRIRQPGAETPTQRERLIAAGLNPNAAEILARGGSVAPGTSITMGGGSGGGAETTFGGSGSEAAEKRIAQLEQEVALFGELTTLQQTRIALEKGFFGDVSEEQETRLIALSKQITKKEKIEELREQEIDRISDAIDAEDEQRKAVERVTQALETREEAIRRAAAEREKIIRNNVEDEKRRAELILRNERKLQKELQRLREASAGELQKLFDNAAENIQRSFGDMFTDVFRNGIDGFQGFADRIKDIFARLAGEIAALFVQRGIGNILLSVSGGTAQGGGGIVGSIGRSIGGGQGLGSLFGGTGLAAKIGTGVLEKAGFNVGAGAASITTQLGAKLGFRGDILAQAAQSGQGVPAGATGRFGGTLGQALGTALAAISGALGGADIVTASGLEGGKARSFGRVGGAIGGAVGSTFGPIGSLLGATSGSISFGSIGQFIDDPSLKNFGEIITAPFRTIETIFKGIGELVGIGGPKDIKLALRTSATGESGPVKGTAVESPFGFIGFSQSRSRTAGTRLSGDKGDKALTELSRSIAQTDQLLADLLDASELPEVRKALEGTGRRIDANTTLHASEIGQIFADRYIRVLEAIDLEIPEELRKAAKKGMDPKKVAELALGPLQERFARRVKEITDEINEIGASLQGNVRELLQFRETFGRVGESIEQQLFSMTATSASPLSPTVRLANARSQFEDLLGRAQGGDFAALQQISGSAQNFLGLARENFASSPEFFERFNFVQESLQGLQGVISQQQGRIDDTLSNLNITVERGNQQNNSRLDSLIELTREQSDRLEELGDKLERLEAA